MNKKQITIDTYDRGAEQLASKFNDVGSRKEDVERAFSFITKENPRVVELGCGNGRDAKEILKYTDDYIGIDASKEMIRLAKDFLPNVDFHVTDMQSYQFPEHIDIIFAFASLIHLNKDEVEELVKNAYEKLNNGGIFYISVKCGNYQETMKSEEFGERFYYLYDISDWQEISKEVGFKIIYEDTQDLRDQKWLTVVLQK